MKVLTRKGLVLAISLWWAPSATAAGWLDFYMPSWIAKPASWIGSCVAPYLPASVTDANTIKKSLEAPLNAAQLLLAESQKVRNEQIFPKIDDIKRDLGQLDESLTAVQKEHENFLEQHTNALNILDQNQQDLNQTLRTTSVQVLALNNQYIDAKKAIEQLEQNRAIQHQELLAQVASIGATFDTHRVQTDALIQKSAGIISEFDRQIEADLISTQKKVTTSMAQLDELIQQNAENSKKITRLLEILKQADKNLEEKRQRKHERRQARREQRAAQNTSSYGLLAQAVNANMQKI